MQAYLARWRNDVYEMFHDIGKDPFGGRRWEKDFVGDVSTDDIRYAIFLGVAAMVPASVIAYVSHGPVIETMARFFSTPVHVAISGFLTSVLLFLGTYVFKIPTEFPVAFKLMLRIMAVYPLLRFLSFSNWSLALTTLIYGFFVVRGAIKTFPISQKNAFLFFGVTYFMFFFLQIQSGFR